MSLRYYSCIQCLPFLVRSQSPLSEPVPLGCRRPSQLVPAWILYLVSEACCIFRFLIRFLPDLFEFDKLGSGTHWCHCVSVRFKNSSDSFVITLGWTPVQAFSGKMFQSAVNKVDLTTTTILVVAGCNLAECLSRFSSRLNCLIIFRCKTISHDHYLIMWSSYLVSKPIIPRYLFEDVVSKFQAFLKISL